MNAYSFKRASSRSWTGFLQHDWDTRLMPVRAENDLWVVRPNGVRIARVDHFLLGKTGGRIEYVVLDGSNSAELDSAYYPVPWELLRHDESMGAFLLEMTEDLLKMGPSYPINEKPDLSYMRCVRLHNHYGLFF